MLCVAGCIVCVCSDRLCVFCCEVLYAFRCVSSCVNAQMCYVQMWLLLLRISECFAMKYVLFCEDCVLILCLCDYDVLRVKNLTLIGSIGCLNLLLLFSDGVLFMKSFLLHSSNSANKGE